MMKVIKNKVYDTEKATLVTSFTNGGDHYGYLKEDLYISDKGQWFKAGTGGVDTEYGVIKDGEIIEGSDLLLLSSDEAFEWFVKNQMFLDNSKEVLEQYFKEMVSEG